jgi:predicted transglutaminase-like protease
MATPRSDDGKKQHKRDEAYWRNKTLTPEQRREEWRARQREKYQRNREERVRKQQERRRLQREYEIAMAAMEQEIDHGE